MRINGTTQTQRCTEHRQGQTHADNDKKGERDTDPHTATEREKEWDTCIGAKGDKKRHIQVRYRGRQTMRYTEGDAMRYTNADTVRFRERDTN
jgi:hypothetical protein